MTPELKEKWLEALRSDRYTQGKHCLRSENNQYCCMGVACDLIDPAKWGDHDGDGFTWGEARSGYTDDVLADALGLSKETMRELAHMNDTQGRSFKMIADWIETHL